ncbi:MAG: DUF1080 domain-containing protein [Bacteroidales bacterium]|jgi:hypothetical protein|nr:DUF1080 domain-containing protein [Bacteroidales bacterium]
MKIIANSILLLLSTVTIYGQTGKYPIPPVMTHEMTEFWTPQPDVVRPGKTGKNGAILPPSDAVVLFDGQDLSQWEKAPDKSVLVKGKDMSKFKSSENTNAQWIVKDGMLTVNKQAGDIQTKQLFGDFQLHIEWRIPEGIQGESQLRGNSGVFLQGIYEVQILDSYNSETYANGQAGSIYKQTAPLVNAMNPPGEWNIYDIIYTAPTFKPDGTYRTYPTVTILHNGILVQHHTRIMGTTPYIGLPQVVEHGKGPIRLQAHADESAPISFRNIWIREW